MHNWTNFCIPPKLTPRNIEWKWYAHEETAYYLSFDQSIWPKKLFELMRFVEVEKGLFVQKWQIWTQKVWDFPCGNKTILWPRTIFLGFQCGVTSSVTTYRLIKLLSTSNVAWKMKLHHNVYLNVLNWKIECAVLQRLQVSNKTKQKLQPTDCPLTCFQEKENILCPYKNLWNIWNIYIYIYIYIYIFCFQSFSFFQKVRLFKLWRKVNLLHLTILPFWHK